MRDLLVNRRSKLIAKVKQSACFFINFSLNQGSAPYYQTYIFLSHAGSSSNFSFPLSNSFKILNWLQRRMRVRYPGYIQDDPKA